jgi:hypothetical protein
MFAIARGGGQPGPRKSGQWRRTALTTGKHVDTQRVAEQARDAALSAFSHDRDLDKDIAESVVETTDRTRFCVHRRRDQVLSASRERKG